MYHERISQNTEFSQKKNDAKVERQKSTDHLVTHRFSCVCTGLICVNFSAKRIFRKLTGRKKFRAYTYSIFQNGRKTTDDIVNIFYQHFRFLLGKKVRGDSNPQLRIAIIQLEKYFSCSRTTHFLQIHKQKRDRERNSIKKCSLGIQFYNGSKTSAKK